MANVWPQASWHHTILACALVGGAAQPATVVLVEHDNITINSSCSVHVPGVVPDADGNGVIHITGSGITVDFEGGALRGAEADTAPNEYAGVGVRVTGRNVTLRGLRVSGYKVGIHAVGADDLTLDDCDVSDNFRQRLGSTPEREDASDWLWPHANDANEWMTNYGAGVCVEDSRRVTLRNIRARNVQNGIILDNVSESLLYDNDCSFLSGWGLAMWRSSSNQITRNAFDFCVRGYSHGVYNRGQDSAGLLMFEQCSDNIIAENSITHGGDGIFAFSGKEALGDKDGAANVMDQNWYRGRGNKQNIIIRNDCSYAAAHGVELTFGFDNSILANRIVGNGICGVWGGYSHRTIVAGNTIEANGEMAYGLERGGVNIEHGMGNWVQANTFANNACGVHLWWDDDAGIRSLPWAQANMTDASRNVIYGNTFRGAPLAIQLRGTKRTFIIDNTFDGVGREMEADAGSEAGILREFESVPPLKWTPPEYQPFGVTTPVGARSHLAGRDKILMTEWGPYDWESPLLRLARRADGMDEYELLGGAAIPGAEAMTHSGDVEIAVQGNHVVVKALKQNALVPYALSIDVNGVRVEANGAIVGGRWDVAVFPSPCDPREDVVRWREGASGDGAHHFTSHELDFNFGHEGIAAMLKLDAPAMRDHFGTLATRSLTFPPGKWRLRTVSDDGIRVWLDDTLVIDDWTWHAPKEHVHEFTVSEAKPIALRVEHFELDGYAVLRLAFERAE